MKSRLASILLCMMPFASAVASDKPAPISTPLIGTGGFSCGKFIEYQRKPNNEAQMDLVVQWVWGYLSAYNAHGFFDVKVGHEVKTVVPPDSPTVLLFLERFCTQNPLSLVAGGTTALLKSLGGSVIWNPKGENQ